MSPEPPPIADPHSSSSVPVQPSSIPRAKGATLLLLVTLGCLTLACGVCIVLAIIMNGVEPVLAHRVGAIDPEAVGSGVLAAVVGIACCWGGFHILRLAFGNQR